MSRVIGENLEFLVFFMDSLANNSKAVTRAADIFAAPLPALANNLRRLIAGVPGIPKFPGAGLKFAKNCVFDRK